MSREERTAAFIRLLVFATLDRRIIDENALRVIENSGTPLNPLDASLVSHSREHRHVFETRFNELLDRGIDWAPVQRTAGELKNKLLAQEEHRIEAREKTKWLPATAPIIVDAVRPGGLVRVNYLCIESDVPKPGWALNISNSFFPFLMLGLTGVILHPLDSLSFDTPGRINRIFEVLEGELGFDIAIGDVWLPSSIFGEAPTSGSVFRVDLDLFQRAYMLREVSWMLGARERNSPWISMFDQIGNLPHPEFSAVETEAFSQWSEQQVRGATEPNPKNSGLEEL